MKFISEATKQEIPAVKPLSSGRPKGDPERKRMKLGKLVWECPENKKNIEITALTDDSRKVQPGALFVCICGPQSDGHRYAAQAVESGAAAVLCERDLGLSQQIVVPDTHRALAEACKAWYGNPLQKLKLVGVTGTNGKTSTTYMIKQILESTGHKTGLIGTIQNMIGDEVFTTNNTTPGMTDLYALFAQMAKAGCEYAVMEVSSHSLDQRRVEGLRFEVAAFTNLTQDHLDYHKTMEKYYEAKKKLFKACKTAVVNMDDLYGLRLIQEIEREKAAKVVSYSASVSAADYRAQNIGYRPDGVDYTLCSREEKTEITLKTGGRFSVYNSMLSAVCAALLGVKMPNISKALAALPGVKGRAEVVPTGRDYTVIIDYAHSPDGLRNILNTFKECPKNRLTVLFGCGGDRDKTKRPKMGAIAAELADFVIVTSDNPRTEEPGSIIADILTGLEGSSTPYRVIENRVEAIEFAIANAEKNDIIVLAGKGHEDYQIIGTQKIHLDEREVVASALAKTEI